LRDRDGALSVFELPELAHVCHHAHHLIRFAAAYQILPKPMPIKQTLQIAAALGDSPRLFASCQLEDLVGDVLTELLVLPALVPRRNPHLTDLEQYYKLLGFPPDSPL